jgi:hypothetical protein
MKIGGKTVEGINVEYCVLPRGDNPDDAVVFKAQAVLDMSGFDKLCPVPKAPKKNVKGVMIEDIERPDYKAMIEIYSNNRMTYMILKSLEATEGLEWDTVDLSDSSTWENYKKDLTNAGFSEIEIMRIINCVMTANCLNETRLEEARNSFLLSQRLRQESLLSPRDAQVSTPSGELAKD